MKKVTFLFSMGLGCAIGAPAGAYDVTTHAALTGRAYDRMLGADPEWLTRLGLNGSDSNPFGEYYYDVSGSEIRVRKQHSFEYGEMPPGLRGDFLAIKGWLMRGAIREDDYVREWYSPAPNPQDDEPYGVIDRPLSHFFDPVNNRALTPTTNAELTFITPNWALGTTDAFANPPPVNTGRRNHFSVPDAREALYRAATGKTTMGGDAGPGGTPGTESVRKAYWATLFRALGDVLHLTQDMGQPQHTRNDLHAGAEWKGNPLYLGGAKSAFEGMMECGAEGGTRRARSLVDLPCDPLPFDDTYPIPQFTKFSDFFSTRVTDGDNGKGLADYSNRGFFSAGTNLGSNSYASPSNDSNAYTPVLVALGEAEPYSFSGTQTPIAYLKGTVPDRLTNNDAADVSMTTLSAWRTPLSTFGGGQDRFGYTLSRHNYKDMAKLVIPRAVAYSAGLVKHFFRAELNISLPSAGVYGILDHSQFLGIDPPSNTRGFHDIKLKIRKVKPTNETMTGTLQAVLTFRRNLCYMDDLTGHPEFVDYHLVKDGGCRSNDEEIVLSDPLDSITVGDTDQELHFYFLNALPINATDVMLRVVFRGSLGNEQDAVVVSAKNLSEPSFYMTLNSLDYIQLGDALYTHEQINADANLLNSVEPQSCVVNGQLSIICFGETTMSSTLTINGGVQVQINLPGPKKFSRIAYLGDAGANVQMYQSGKCSFSGPDIAMRWDNQYYPMFQTLRGISRWGASNCVFNGNYAAWSLGYDPSVMTPIVPPDTVEPVPVTITGY